MKRYTVTLMILFVCAGLFAQGEMDAIRLSGGDLRGTARGQAMGGAFGALGGDVTGILINPAGLGVYRSSEINATLALNTTPVKTDWQNTINKEGSTKVNFDNISYVGYYPTGNMSVPVLNFAFSYNRLKNFNRRYSASGKGMNSSLTNYIAAITNGIHYEDMNAVGNYDPYANRKIPWLSTLGWLGYFINDVSDNSYSGLFSDETVSPQLNINERGSIESYDFSLGTHFSDKLYLGFTLALTNISYSMSSYYGEKFSHSGNIGLNNSFETDGSGFQFIFGGIWRPVDFLRLGVAYHSPTWYTLTDYYQAHTTADYEGVDPDNTWAKTPDDAWTHYRFNTPYSWVFSAAGIIGTKAIVSVDYEWKDYTSMKLMDNEKTPKADNQYIQDDFRATSILRTGFEYRLTPQLSGRVGYSNAQHPYEKRFQDGWKEAVIVGTVPHFTIDGDVNYFTAGIGYRFTPYFYIDAALVYRTQKDDLYSFPSVIDVNGNFIVDSKPASVINRSYKGLVTVGYKF